MINTIDLSGKWFFSFEKPTYEDTITLPGTTAMAEKGTPGGRQDTGYLTERYPYTGRAYFSRDVTLPPEAARDKASSTRLILFLERTRISRLWVNEKEIGSCNYLTTPHRYDISEFARCSTLHLELEIANLGYPTPGGHMTSPDTQTNWLGIMGRMEIQIYGSVYIEHVKAYLPAETESPADDDTLCFDCRLAGELIPERFQKTAPSPYRLRLFPEAVSLKGLIGADSKNYDILPERAEWESTPLPMQETALYGSRYLFEADAPRWSEHSPVVYRFSVQLVKDNVVLDTYTFYTGLRRFAAAEHDFLINGIPTKLRGKHDALLFPRTGAAPMKVEDYLHTMGAAWKHGINHYRYHTCCPPEAAFTAADLLGIMLEPELPFWGTIAGEGEEGYNAEEQQYLIDEGIRILREYGSHPSFCMMSLGNELWGNHDRINEILTILKTEDSRPLYTQGSNNFQFVPEVSSMEDFYVGARLAPPENGENKRLIRGSYAACDAPLGVIQTKAPSTGYDFDEAILPSASEASKAEPASPASGPAGRDIAIQYGTGVKTVRSRSASLGVCASLPIVSHEIGQYSMYPDYNEIEKFDGVLSAENFKIFRKRLENAGMGGQAQDFFLNSGRFAAACYRQELEMMHRSRYMAGYQLLDLQDYTGQGTSLVGVLDAFMDSKGVISPLEWRRFCSDDVILASFDSYVAAAGGKFTFDVLLSHYNPLRSLEGKKLLISLTASSDEKSSLAHAELLIPSLKGGQGKDSEIGTHRLGCVTLSLPLLNGKDSQKLTLSLEIEGTEISQEYSLWLYPSPSPASPWEDQEYVAVQADTAWNMLSSGKDVLFFPSKVNESIPGFYCTDFWNYTMFRQISESMNKPVAPGTLGLNIESRHPALSGFACESYSTPQWYNILTGSPLAVLDGIGGEKLTPIVQMIDNVERNHKLGLVFEADVKTGADKKPARLLVCTSDFGRLMSVPEGQALYRSLLNYIRSDRKTTDVCTLTRKEFETLFAV